MVDTSVIEDLNTEIRSLAKDKVRFLTKIKSIKQQIRKKKWENKGLDMQMEDLQDQIRYFQLLVVVFPFLSNFLSELLKLCKSS